MHRSHYNIHCLGISWLFVCRLPTCSAISDLLAHQWAGLLFFWHWALYSDLVTALFNASWLTTAATHAFCSEALKNIFYYSDAFIFLPTGSIRYSSSFQNDTVRWPSVAITEAPRKYDLIKLDAKNPPKAEFSSLPCSERRFSVPSRAMSLLDSSP